MKYSKKITPIIILTLVTSHNLIRLFENPEQELIKQRTPYLHPMGVDLWNYIYENLYKPIPETQQEYIKTGYESFQVPFVNTFHSIGGKLLSGSDVLIPPNLPGYSLHKELYVREDGSQKRRSIPGWKRSLPPILIFQK